MKIAATAVSMDAARTYREVEQRFTGLSMGAAQTEAPEQTDLFGIRLAAMLASSTQTELTCRSEVSRASIGNTPPFTDSKTGIGSESTLARLAEQVIGQPVTVSASATSPPLSPQLAPKEGTASPFVNVHTANLVSGTMYSQEESLLFSAKGTVNTVDGRKIAFDLGLSMERSTVAATTSSLEISALFIDPLILQFDLDSPLLSNSTFLFDLDSDGTGENLACPGGGCGFLAFDRNGDGLINNGLELFGPDSGSGFGELAELDSDANFWIDENDPSFDQLLIWSPDGQGKGSLKSLRDAGVGAIGVANAGTSFQLEKADGTILGSIKSSGIFLTEDGEVRSLEEIDLALPDTRPDIGPNGVHSSANTLESALKSLRDIISMQRLRLQMMLTGEHLRHIVAQREKQRDLLQDWFQESNTVRDRVDSRRGNENNPEPGSMTASRTWRSLLLEIDKSG